MNANIAVISDLNFAQQQAANVRRRQHQQRKARAAIIERAACAAPSQRRRWLRFYNETFVPIPYQLAPQAHALLSQYS